MDEHTKWPRYTWRLRAANTRCIIIDGQKDGVIICETTNAKSADLICTNMNALEGYNPDAVRDVVEALDWAIAEIEKRTRYSPDDYYEARDQRASALEKAKSALSLARLGGAS
mgnify:FL=1